MPTPPKPRTRYPKPVIGIAGGIGSGKSFVAQAFVPLGAGLISSDADAHAALQIPQVKAQLLAWFGPAILKPDGTPDRKQIAAHVFTHPESLQKLNALIHPLVAQARQQHMAALLADPQIQAIVWDTPLLFETGLDPLCTAVVFVHAPPALRLQRVTQSRGWTPAELEKRENLQFPLDKKALLADYSVDNSGDVTDTLRQVRETFSQILSKFAIPEDRP